MPVKPIAFPIVLLIFLPVVVCAQSNSSPAIHATRYDAARRVTGTIAPDPDGSDGELRYAAVRNTYDDAGRLTKVERGQLSSWQGESVAPANWAGFEMLETLKTTYDDLGRKTIERRIGKTDITYAVTQFSYNNVGLLHCTAVRMNSADIASPPPDACKQTGVVNGVPDRITRNTYDKAGQLTSVEQGVGSTVEQFYVRYEYTDNGKRRSVTDANGNRAEMEYDGFDRQSKWIFPFATGDNRGKPNSPVKDDKGNYIGGDFEEYGYDANGNRTSFRKRTGQTINFTYDALNRLTEKRMPEKAGARSVFYGYDLRGLQTSACFDSATGSDCVKNEYDGFGRITSTATSMGSFSRKLKFDYDANGNRTSITHPDNTSFAYTFDGLDRLNGIKQGNTVLLTAEYNSRGSLKTLDHKGSPTAVKTIYDYDENGRLATQELTGSGLKTTLKYNAAGQISSRILSNLNHAFNAHANFVRGYKVNGLNQYSDSGLNKVDYDYNGNLTSVTPPNRDPESYTYDIENRLLSKGTGTLSAQNPPSTSLTYDPLGRLFSVAEDDGTQVRFLYDGDQLSAEYDAAGNLLRRYLHGFGDDDPLIWYEGSGLGERRILQANHQGSIVAVVAASGTVLQANGYDEYGITNPRNMGRFQFTGQAWFNRLGLYHYKARFYSPSMGRFLQTDPIGYDDQINLYAYVANDPVNGRDPDGKQTVMGPVYDGLDRATAACGSDPQCGLKAWNQVQQGVARNVAEAAAWDLAGVAVFKGAGLAWDAYKAGRVAEATRPASSAAQGVLLRQNLLRQAVVGARNELRAGGGKPIAGAGTDVALRDAPRLAAKYGGEAGDYAKVTSRVVGETSNGATVQVHAYRNVETGALYEAKLKIQ